MRKFDNLSAKLSLSPKHCRAVAENVTKPLVFMYHKDRSIFLGSKKGLNSVYLWGVYFWGLTCPKFSIFLGFSKIYCNCV